MWCLCDTDLCNGQSIKRMSRSRYSEYSPKLNQVYDSDNYIEADYIHDNEKTKLMPNSASGMYGYAKEGPMDDTYQEPHMKLWESGYNDVYNIYNNNGHSNYRDESYSTQKNDERDYYDSSNYRMIQQYSRSDEEKDEYDRNDFYNYNDVHQARYDNQAGWMDYSYDRGDGHQVLKEGVEEEDDNYSSEVSPELGKCCNLYHRLPTVSFHEFSTHSICTASQIRCSKTGYYQNPHDCRQFIACLMDPHSNVPIMHLMRCPPGLVFDNRKKICLTHSATCNSGTDYYEYDSHSQPRDSTYNIRPSYDSEFPRNENKRLEDNYENMLYDSEKKIDTTGFVQGGTGPDNKHAYNVDDHYDAKYNENFIDDYDNIYNGNDYGSYDLKHIQNRG